MGKAELAGKMIGGLIALAVVAFIILLPLILGLAWKYGHLPFETTVIIFLILLSYSGITASST